MQLKTLLNHVQPVKGFVYQKCTLRADAQAVSGHAIDVTLRPRKGSRGIRTGCGQRAGTYDTLRQRAFAFVPLWGMAVYLLYARRRVNCPTCGVKVEALPWADG
jgi:transposase